MSSEHLNQTAAELGSVLLDKVVCDATLSVPGQKQ